jgi:WD40 repeat protein
LAVAGSDNTIRILGWNSAVPQLKLIGHDGSVSVLQKTDRFLISAGFDTTIRLWDLQRAFREQDHEGRYSHPVAAQFEDSGLATPGTLVKTPIQ